MTYAGGGEMSGNEVLTSLGVAIIDEREETQATARWSRVADYPAATSPQGHRWQGYYTPTQPPRTLYYSLL